MEAAAGAESATIEALKKPPAKARSWTHHPEIDSDRRRLHDFDNVAAELVWAVRRRDEGLARAYSDELSRLYLEALRQ